jgi:hypothetical protein
MPTLSVPLYAHFRIPHFPAEVMIEVSLPIPFECQLDIVYPIDYEALQSRRFDRNATVLQTVLRTSRTKPDLLAVRSRQFSHPDTAPTRRARIRQLV